MREGLKGLGLAAGAVVVLCLLLEGLLAWGQWTSRAYIQFHPGQGITFIPHARYVHRKEGYSRGRFNAHGFRDRERTWDKPPGTRRIVILGDSYVEAMQVGLDEAFPALLEDALARRCGPGKWEVLALGQSGFGTGESWLRYRHFARRYDPDIVLLAITTGNDFRNNHKALNRGATGHYFVLDGDSELTVDESLYEEYEAGLSPVKRAFHWLRNRSYLLSLISQRLQLLRQQMRGSIASESLESGGRTVLEPGSDLNIYQDDAGPLWDEAVEITRRTLLMMNEEVARDGALLVAVSLTNPEQVQPSVGDALQELAGGRLDYERPERLLARWCAEAGIPYLPLVPPLRAYHLATGEYLHGFGDRRTGHWNQVGHRQAAREIESFLVSAGLLDCPDRGQETSRLP